MSLKERFKSIFFNKEGKLKHKPWYYVVNGLVSALIIFLLVFSGLEFADKKSGFRVLNTHNAVIVSDSMSYAHPDNLSYLTPEMHRIEKGDIVKAREYKSFDDIQLYDVVIYSSEDGLLICHRVVNKYVDEKGSWVVTKGDANGTEDMPVSFDIVRGKVIKTVKGLGKVIMFMQTPYFLIGVFGTGFFIFLGLFIANYSKESGGKKPPKQKEEAKDKNKKASSEIKTAKSNKNQTVTRGKDGKFVSNKTNIILVLLVSSSLTGALISLGNANALFTKGANQTSFGIGAQSIDTNYYVNIYNGNTLVSSNLLEVNPDNSNELRILNLQVQKGYKVKAFKAPDNYYGTNYEHNIAVGISTDTGLLSNNDDYIAVQTGTYDFYYKFTDSTYETCNGVYVNVDDVRTLYLQDYWNTTGSPYIHYWGDDVITSDAGENYVRGEYVGVEGGKNMYRVYIPSNARYFNLKKYDGSAYSTSVDINTIGANNAIWYNDGGIGSYTWNP